jgi:hypothetical protein
VSSKPQTLLRGALTASIVAVAGCASSTLYGDGPDDMCRQIADFANASQDGALHEVRLITDWGGTTCSTPDEPAMYCKACRHDAYSPGKKLCDYLMENTATEFAEVNLARALSCLNLGYGHLKLGPRLDALADREFSSTHAASVKRGISVGVEYRKPAPEGDYVPPTLILSAQSDRAGARQKTPPAP